MAAAESAIEYGVLETLRTTAESTAKIDLSRTKILTIPVELLRFKTLEYLYLEANRLDSIPMHFFLELPALTYLDLRHNQLTGLPKSVGWVTPTFVLSE